MPHTEGTWLARTSLNLVVVESDNDAGFKTIAEVYGETQEEIEANTRLISAAPLLLATLKSIRGTLIQIEGESTPVIDSIIAKAEGRA